MSGEHPRAAGGCAEQGLCAGARCGAPVRRHVPCRRRSPRRIARRRCREVFVCGGWRCPTPSAPHPCRRMGSPKAPQPHTLAGAAAGPRGPAAVANLASIHQCVVKALDAGPLSSCYQPGEAVTWHIGRAWIWLLRSVTRARAFISPQDSTWSRGRGLGTLIPSKKPI